MSPVQAVSPFAVENLRELKNLPNIAQGYQLRGYPYRYGD
jgi:hypothetical protein